ncbi:efflux transporter outer membrane subunit [Pedomonas sp. V897]|uniref:efflux transporter outer membrane subunit n=1 Tax=Pedomonas sp. V897 TaxID=3446482 RepID=UPI003EE310AD
MRGNRTAVLLVCVLPLAACSFAPEYRRPALPTASTYGADLAPDAGGPVAVETGWRQFFRDARLQRLIGLALENNRDLREAVLRIEEARAQYRIQRADQLPNLDLGGSATRIRAGAGTAGGVAGGGSAAPGLAGSSTINRYEIGVSVSAFELDFWGRVRNLTEAARAAYLATIEAQRAFQLSLIADVATVYLVDRELEERIALAERTVRTRTEGLEIARLRLEAGVISELDYRQTETLLTQAQTELAILQRQRAQNRNAMQVLIGGPVPQDLPAPQPLSQQGIIETISAGLPSDLLVNRPDVLAAEEQLRAANANIGAARAAFFPRISLTGFLGFASTDLDALFGDDGETWSFGANLALPVFDAGRNAANVDLAVARRDIAIANYERTIQVAFREVADALAARRWLAEQFDAQQRALAAERERAELAELRYRNGVADYIEVLDAQRQLFAAEQSLVETRQLQLSNAVALYVALGGGLRPDSAR